MIEIIDETQFLASHSHKYRNKDRRSVYKNSDDLFPVKIIIFLFDSRKEMCLVV